ncbi:MAG: hypothetical protein GF401_01735 [Chitinivibrionales bacterium]|nr:hypothetical protein [Chitinivibrionales bacterium]
MNNRNWFDILIRGGAMADASAFKRYYTSKVVGAVLIAVSCSFSVTYYVSPDGDDGNDGSESSPYKTLIHARDVLRGISGESKTVIIKSGNYYLDEPLVLNENDGGTEQYPVVWKGEDINAMPAIYGGRRIEGWEPSGKPGIYKAYVGSTDWEFWSVSENGKRCQNARHPNHMAKSNVYEQFGYYNTLNENRETSRGIKNNIYYNAGDFPSQWDYSHARVTTSPGWFTDARKISNVDFGNRMITTDPGFMESGNYWVEGSKDFIDRPGEWALDGDGYLYIWPKTTPIEDQVIVAAKSMHVIKLMGSDESNPVKHVTIEGLLLSTSDSPDTMYNSKTSPQCPTDECHENNCENDEMRLGLVHLENAEYCTIKFCKVWNAGVMAILLNYHARHNTIYGNWVEGVNYFGIYLCSHCVLEGPWTDKNSFNTIENNYVHDFGKLLSGVAGIGLYQSSDNLITHNEIRRGPRYGLSIKGQYLANDPTAGFNISERNIMTYNDISHCTFATVDLGAIEFWHPGTGCKLYNNSIHDLYHLSCPTRNDLDRPRFNCHLSQRHCIYPDAGPTPCKVGDDSIMVNAGWNGVDIVNWYIVGPQPIPFTRSAAREANERKGFTIDEAGVLDDFPWHTPGQNKLEYEWPCEIVWDPDNEEAYAAQYFTNGDGLKAEYYTNATLAGTPAKTGIEPWLAVNLGDYDNVRLTGWVVPMFSEEYRFNSVCYGTIKVWVNDILVSEGSGNGRQNFYGDMISLQAHTAYPIKVELTGGSRFAVDWWSESQPITYIPQTQLFSSEASPDIQTGTTHPSVRTATKEKLIDIGRDQAGILIKFESNSAHSFQLLSMNGRIAKTENGFGHCRYSIPAGSVGNGVYIIHAFTGTQRMTRKIVLNR